MAQSPQTELRLDSLINPFAPVPAAIETSKCPGDCEPRQILERIRALLAEIHQVNPAHVIVGVSPPEMAPDRDEYPSDSEMRIQIAASPDIETGSMVPIREAIRLARRSGILILDERAAGFAHRDHLPLFREFEHVALYRSLDSWLGPLGVQFGYLLCKDLSFARLVKPHDHWDPLTLQRVEATLTNWDYVAAANRRIVRERVHLFRSLRKLNMVRPWPSASSFVSLTVERGDRASMRRSLESQGILLHYPEEPCHANRARISAVSHRATSRLTAALIEWALTL
ncbi:MAG: hypothetical protein AB7G88_07370 [Thermomicrobiales bacterium]